MKIENKSFADIFKESHVQYKIPFFQRGYVWDLKQQKELCQDIENYISGCSYNKDEAQSPDNLSKESGYFFGSVVVKQMPHCSDNSVQYLIIDGQQRLTTIYVILAVIRRRFQDLEGKRENLNVGDYANQLAQYLENRRMGNESSRLKVLSTRGDAYATYKAIFRGMEPATRDELHGDVYTEKNKISEIVKFWDRKLRVKQDEQLWLFALVLLHSLEMVWIPLEESQSEQIIFESLNAKGTPLTGIELICNYIFSPLMLPDSNKNEYELLNKTHWLKPSFAIEMRRSNAQIDRIRSADYSQFESYVRYLFSIGREKTLPQGKDYRMTYYAFKKLHPDLELKDAREFIERIHENASIFCDIIDANRRTIENPQINEFVDQINKLLETSVNSVIIFLLAIFRALIDHKITEKEVKLLLDQTLTMIVRGKLSGKNFKYDTFFPSLTENLLKNDNKSEEFMRLIKDKNFYIADDIFMDSVKRTPLYNDSKGGMSWCRFILQEIDTHISEKQYSKQRANYSTLNTIEHILPQTFDASWKESISPEEHRDNKSNINSIGNLMLVSAQNNASASNRPFESKLDCYNGNPSALYNNLMENLKKDEKNKPLWTLEAIMERSESLAKQAKNVWSYSGTS